MSWMNWKGWLLKKKWQILIVYHVQEWLWHVQHQQCSKRMMMKWSLLLSWTPLRHNLISVLHLLKRKRNNLSKPKDQNQLSTISSSTSIQMASGTFQLNPFWRTSSMAILLTMKKFKRWSTNLALSLMLIKDVSTWHFLLFTFSKKYLMNKRASGNFSQRKQRSTC